jgi:hypothetical protein
MCRAERAAMMLVDQQASIRPEGAEQASALRWRIDLCPENKRKKLIKIKDFL